MANIPPIQENGGEVTSFPERNGLPDFDADMDKNALVQVDTAKSEGSKDGL